MTTVADLLRDALGHIKVLDAGEAIEAEDARDAIRALNLMVTRWEAGGLALGWVNVSGPNDTLPLPFEAEETVGAHLAIRLAGRYGATLDGSVIEIAREGYEALLRDRLAASPIHHGVDLPSADAGVVARIVGFFR